ncbi:hypothetical protein [Natronoglycomyces albus]|uniref:Uncharacterized protein n=1 Tax=Natronoglycomyces albus TaxID=2811108 RepID=A0A895XT56_9ACTN|nr:hypothetical protein [Natronoglycomyces albus]QSB04818.1 hypothetical protein JQS30_13750 [Natronoglycomyces albus]
MSLIINNATDICESTNATPLSALLEATCRARDLRVDRLRSNLVSVAVGEHQLIFAGCSGPSTSRVAITLGKDIAWLRRTLEIKGVPVPLTVKIPEKARAVARTYLEDLGEPARAWWIDQPQTSVTLTVEDFKTGWKELLEHRPEDPKAQIVFEPADLGPTEPVTVVFGSVVNASGDLTNDERDLAMRTVSIIPGAEVAEVHLTRLPKAGTLVSHVDIKLDSWNVTPYREGSEKIITAIVDGEFSRIN